QILDQVGDGEPKAEQDKAADGRPQHSAPAPPPWACRYCRVDGNRQCRAVRLPRYHDAAAPVRWRGIDLGHDDVAVVEVEGGWLAGRALVHRSLSPSRNCSARSSRICGSADVSGAASGKAGGRTRKKRRSLVL